MTQLAHATESRFAPMEKVFHTTKADTTGRHPMKRFRGFNNDPLPRSWVADLRCNLLLTEAPPSLAEQIAKAYGLDSYGQIDAVRYTFNLQFPGVTVSRTWIFEPKTGQVTYEAKDKDGKPVKATYLRSQLSSQSDTIKNEIDPGFINDNYWFMLPFHVYWDTSANVQDKGVQPLPLGNGSARLVSVKYPSDVGYTPGDTWDLYLGRTTASSNWFITAAGPRSRASSSPHGKATRKAALSLSRLSTAVRRTEGPSTFSFRMWLSSWRARIPG